MKTKPLVFFAAAAFCASFLIFFACNSFAQSTAATSADTLNEATNLLYQGEPAQAEQLLTTIGSNDSQYPAAQCYEALCLYGMTNHLGFLKKMESPIVSQAVIPTEVRKDLAFKYVKTLFAYRQFEKILPAIQLFQSNYVNAAQSPAVLEYQMAALYERGMKKAIETANLGGDDYNYRWSEARSNLQQFLSIALTFKGTNYAFIPDRNLKENIWRTQIALGDGPTVLSVIPTNDILDQERFSFLQIELFEALHPTDVDSSMKLMSAYLSKFPASADRSRIQMLMTEYAFRKGEQIANLANSAEKSGNTAMTAQLRAAAAPYFDQMRYWQSQIATNDAAGIMDSDVVDSEEDLLYSYYLQEDYNSLLNTASAMAAQSHPGDIRWIIARLYTGIGLASMSDLRINEADAALNSVTSLGFVNHPQQDHFVLYATMWRIRLAQRTGDLDKAAQLVLWVNGSNCTKNMKAQFLKDFGWIAGLKAN